MSSTIRFNYLYRDASNYKEWGSVDFTNPEKLALNEIEQSLRKNFDQGELFIAHQIKIPELFFYAAEPITEDDHCYHEFGSLEEIDTAASETPSRSISDFINTIELAATTGWEAFNPADRLPKIKANALDTSN